MLTFVLFTRIRFRKGNVYNFDYFLLFRWVDLALCVLKLLLKLTVGPVRLHLLYNETIILGKIEALKVVVVDFRNQALTNFYQTRVILFFLLDDMLFGLTLVVLLIVILVRNP